MSSQLLEAIHMKSLSTLATSSSPLKNIVETTQRGHGIEGEYNAGAQRRPVAMHYGITRAGCASWHHC